MMLFFFHSPLPIKSRFTEKHRGDLGSFPAHAKQGKFTEFTETAPGLIGQALSSSKEGDPNSSVAKHTDNNI